MAQFPYLLQAGFETGATDFDSSLTDSTSKSAYLNYKQSVKQYGITPWRGAYCWVIDQSLGTTTTSCYQTQAAFNVSANNYWSSGFALLVKNTAMTNGDRTSIWKASASGTDEVCLQLYYTSAAGLQLLLTETAATAVGSNPVAALTENVWHWIELYGRVDAGAGNDGNAYLVLDGNLVGSITSLDQGAFTDLYVGAMDIDAGHTAGLIAFDDVLASGVDTSSQVRIGLRARYPMNPHVSALASSTYVEHIFVGPGTVDEAVLLTANAGDTLRLYDTDAGTTTGTYPGSLVGEANYSSGYPVIPGPLAFRNGCLVQVVAAGANGARGIVKISQAPPTGYPAAICYGNDANLRWRALGR